MPKYLLVILLFVMSRGLAQDKKPLYVADVFKATVINPGLSAEKAIAKFQTLYFQAFMNPSVTLTQNDQIIKISRFYFDPAFTGQYRLYYNFRKREQMAKRIDLNSANYLAVVYEGTFSKAVITEDYLDENKRRLMNRTGIVWGLQRNFQNRFSLDLNLGLGYLFAKSTKYDYFQDKLISGTAGSVIFLGQVNIGFWLNKRS